jgi:hypothetical protein
MGWMVWVSNLVVVSFSEPVQTGPWGPHTFLYNGYRASFPKVKRPWRGVKHTPASNAEIRERIELCLYSPSGPSWLLPRWNLVTMLGDQIQVDNQAYCDYATCCAPACNSCQVGGLLSSPLDRVCGKPILTYNEYSETFCTGIRAVEWFWAITFICCQPYGCLKTTLHPNILLYG